MKNTQVHIEPHEPCPSCGRDREHGWRSCPVCGSDYDSREVVAVKGCRHSFVDEGEFCVSCGARFIAPLRRPIPRSALVGSGMALLTLVLGLVAWFFALGFWPERGGGLLAGLALLGSLLIASGLKHSRRERGGQGSLKGEV